MIKPLASLVSVTLIVTASTYLTQVAASHIIPYDSFGIFAKWITDIGFFSSIFIFGLDSAIQYYSKHRENFNCLALKNISIYLIFTSICLLISIVFLNNQIYYNALLLSTLLLALVSTFLAFFQIQEDFFSYKKLLFYRSFFAFVIFVISWFASIEFSVEDAIAAYSFGIILSFFLSSKAYFSRSNLSLSNGLFHRKDYLAFGFRASFNRSLSLILYATSFYCVYYTLGSKTAGIYFIASSLAKLAWVLPDSAGNLLYPRFIKASDDQRKNQVLNDMIIYTQLIFIINVVAVILFVFVGEFLLSVIYDDKYVSAYVPITILLLGNQGMVFYKLMSRYYASQNDWRHMRYVLILTSVINIILNLVLAKKYGVVGAAIGTSISFWICGILMFAKKSYLLNELFNFKHFSKSLPRMFFR